MSVSDYLTAADLAGGRVTRIQVSRKAARGAKRLGQVVQSANAGPVEMRRGTVHVPIPIEIVEVLRSLADALGNGSETMTVFVVGDADHDASTELTSQQAADVLNVSRPHVVKLARDGVLPHRMVGNRHRFLVSDVRAYRQREAARRAETLAGLAPEGGYMAGDF